VAVITRPEDLKAARDSGWHRVPEKKAPRGAFLEYLAFYFTVAFGEQGWAVHYYARRLGHELVARRDVLPDEPDHPRAEEPYYKLQLGPLQKREPPIAVNAGDVSRSSTLPGTVFKQRSKSTTCLSKVGSSLIGCTMPCAIPLCLLSDITQWGRPKSSM
jgi:hypothetical protein